MLLFGGMFVTAGICAVALPFLVSIDGVTGPAILQTEAPILAMAVTVGRPGGW